VEIKIECVGKCWLWQPLKIVRLRKVLGGYFGGYLFNFKDGQIVDEKIEYVHIRPLLWRWVLYHEVGHSEVVRGSTSIEEANLKTLFYDHETHHGIFQLFGWLLYEGKRLWKTAR
jgi:hypothetical protein